MSRCCDSGGLMRYVNRSVECRRFILPYTLNEAPAYLDVDIHEAMETFSNSYAIEEGYLCKEIVFDQNTGLVINAIITVTDQANKTEQTFTDLQRYQVKRCCQLKSYHRTLEGKIYEKDCTPFSSYNIEPLEEFSKYYIETDYESKLTCSTNLTCLHKYRQLYILGDEILDMSLRFKYPEVANIVNEMETINYCLNDYGGPSSDIDFCICPEDFSKFLELQGKMDKILESVLETEKSLTYRESHAPVNNSGLFLICNTDIDNNLKPWFESSNLLTATSVFTNFTTPFDAVPRNHTKILLEILKNKENSFLNSNLFIMCPKEKVRVVENVTILESAELYITNLDKKLEISEHCLALDETSETLMAYYCDKSDINVPNENQCSCSRDCNKNNITIIIT